MNDYFKWTHGNFAFSHLFDRVMMYGFGGFDDEPHEYWHRVAFGLYYKSNSWMPGWWY